MNIWTSMLAGAKVKAAAVGLAVAAAGTGAVVAGTTLGGGDGGAAAAIGASQSAVLSAGTAGSVRVAIEGDGLVLLDIEEAAGFRSQVTADASGEVIVEFASAGEASTLRASLVDGRIVSHLSADADASLDTAGAEVGADGSASAGAGAGTAGASTGIDVSGGIGIGLGG